MTDRPEVDEITHPCNQDEPEVVEASITLLAGAGWSVGPIEADDEQEASHGR